MEPPPRAQLFLLTAGFMVTQSVGVVVRLGLAELVTARPRTTDRLAAAAGADPDAIRRLVRTLASVGVFDVRDGVVVHTPMSELLQRDVEGSFAAQAEILSGLQYGTWADALETFRSGEPAFPRVHGSPVFDWFTEHPEHAALFNDAMAGGAVARREPLRARDWTGVRTVVDVGGGSGETLVQLLLDLPDVRGTVLDLAQVEPQARERFAAAGVADRAAFVAGSFFRSVPAGADVYVLSAILHDWNDDDAARILQTVRTAMRLDSLLLLAEAVIRPGNELDPAKLLDLHMLVLLGGRERSEHEWRALLDRGGFTAQSVRPGIIEARPR